MTQTPQAVLSVDLELFEHTPAARGADEELSGTGIGRSGVAYLREQFETRSIETTWFVVGEVAETHPEMVAELAESGHEIGGHTHTHRLLGELEPDERRQELERSKRALESATGQTVDGFRAPAFDIPPAHFAQLAAEGYTYDSSVLASRRIPGWYGGEFELERPAPARAVDEDAPGGIDELPVSVMRGVKLPLTGTWLRFFGPRYTLAGMQWLRRRGIAPVLYVHPWEFVDLPDVSGVPRRVYYHTGAWMRRAVNRILGAPFDFVTARKVLSAARRDRDAWLEVGER